MSSNLTSVKGMRDILPAETKKWQSFEKIIRTVAKLFGYGELRTPIVEHSELFSRSLGAQTEVVQKEMYSFADSHNQDLLTLRPEATAATVRAYINSKQSNLLPLRWYYLGPMFRHERPQQGRYRQFHQVGCELLGSQRPIDDAEIILLCERLWQELGIADQLSLVVNNLGMPNERENYRAQLRKYYLDQLINPEADLLEKININPMRLLDSKAPNLIEINQQAPQLGDFLGDSSKKYVDEVLNILSASSSFIPQIDPKLVRGLDYYNLTVFEWIPKQQKHLRQATICGGGRYDGLAESLGGKSLPSIGFALGIERVLGLCDDEYLCPSGKIPLVYVASLKVDDAYQKQCLNLAQTMRSYGLNCYVGTDSKNIRWHLQQADLHACTHSILIGARELEQQVFQIKTQGSSETRSFVVADLPMLVKQLNRSSTA